LILCANTAADTNSHKPTTTKFRVFMGILLVSLNCVRPPSFIRRCSVFHADAVNPATGMGHLRLFRRLGAFPATATPGNAQLMWRWPAGQHFLGERLFDGAGPALACDWRQRNGLSAAQSLNTGRPQCR